MAVTQVRFRETVDKVPEYLHNGDRYEQGAEYPTFHVYELINDDGTTQFLKIVTPTDSYGEGGHISDVSLTTRKEQKVTVWR